ncbi:hypothetical protein V6N12_053732 [Hibiscus sabdariffa]|uniref:Uncharacterized protein n=1 Tax=Hibiscus sabdariffa TaxID=183260 RepID=A0ABR2D8F4_9ROSI
MSDYLTLVQREMVLQTSLRLQQECTVQVSSSAEWEPMSVMQSWRVHMRTFYIINDSVFAYISRGLS